MVVWIFDANLCTNGGFSVENLAFGPLWCYDMCAASQAVIISYTPPASPGGSYRRSGRLCDSRPGRYFFCPRCQEGHRRQPPRPPLLAAALPPSGSHRAPGRGYRGRGAAPPMVPRRGNGEVWRSPCNACARWPPNKGPPSAGGRVPGPGGGRTGANLAEDHRGRRITGRPGPPLAWLRGAVTRCYPRPRGCTGQRLRRRTPAPYGGVWALSRALPLGPQPLHRWHPLPPGEYASGPERRPAGHSLRTH